MDAKIACKVTYVTEDKQNKKDSDCAEVHFIALF